MQTQPGDGEFTPRNSLGQRALQGFGSLRRDLVLDRDVEARRMSVLRGKGTVKMLGDALADCERGRTAERDCGPLAEVHQPFDPRHRRRELSGNFTLYEVEVTDESLEHVFAYLVAR